MRHGFRRHADAFQHAEDGDGVEQRHGCGGPHQGKRRNCRAQAPTRKEVEQEVAASAPDLSAEHRAEVIARVMQSFRSSEALANAMADVRAVNAKIARAAAISNTEARIQALGAQQQALAALVAAEIRAHEIEMEDEAILLMAA